MLTASLANNDQLILAGPFTFDERIDAIMTHNASPALTAAVANLGFMYMSGDGTLVEIKSGGSSVLWSATTALQAALSTRDLLMSINTGLNTTQNIGELLALGTDQEPAGGVYLVLTFTTKPSVDGVLDVDVMVEEANTK